MDQEKHDSELSEIGDDDDQVGSFEDDNEEGISGQESLQQDADLGLEDYEEGEKEDDDEIFNYESSHGKVDLYDDKMNEEPKKLTKAEQAI